MDRIERLEAIEAIRSLKARYYRLMDTKAWGELPGLFTADMKVLTPAGEVYAEGGQAYADSLRNSLEQAVSCHQGLSGEIEILDETNAKAIWAMQDVIEWETAHPRFGWKSILGRGHYHETYRKEQGEWRIATLMLTRIRLDTTMPDEGAAE
ncbi:MAG: nuclear transport factor 2 family protein [Sphingomonadaceae bacterium]